MLLEKIQDDLKTAQKAKNEFELKTLRMLMAAIKNKEIAKRPKELGESDVEQIVKREVKKLKDAVVEFEAGGRDDLAVQYKEEVSVLKKYMPEQMSEEAVREVVVAKVLEAEDKSNFGLIMKSVMAKTAGKADGGLVSKLVKEQLSK